MNDDPRRRSTGFWLESNSHPAVAFIVTPITLGGDGVGEGKERCLLTSLFGEPFVEEPVFVVEHGNEPFARDIARSLAVNLVAESHVVSRHGLGDCARGTAGLEKQAGHFLAGPDFGKCPVATLI